MLKTLTVILVLAGGVVAFRTLGDRSVLPPPPEDDLAPGVPVLSDWDEAIREAKEGRRLLLIYDGWDEEGRCLACEGLSTALGFLAQGALGFERYASVLKDRFVVLRVGIGSEDEAFGPRGPEGPFRFEARDVPNLIIKRWDGLTLVNQRSFYPDSQEALRLLASLIDEALARHAANPPPAQVG